MKRTWWLVMVLVIFAGILVVACYFFGIFLESAVRGGIAFVAKNLAPEGIVIEDPDFDGISVGLFPPSVSVKAFSAHMVVTQHNVFQIDRNFFINIGRVTVSLSDFNTRSFLFTIKGAVITLQPEYGASYNTAKKEDERDRLEVTQLQVPFQANIFNRNAARTQAQALVRELAKFAKYGTTEIQMRFTGASAFVVRERPVHGKLVLIPIGKLLKLVMDRKDFEEIAKLLGEKLTDTEFGIYCNNPLRLPRMLRVRNYASDTAYRVGQDNQQISDKCYKHILWAFLLVKAYDEKFSAETTDAYEINPAGAGELSVREYLPTERGRQEREAGGPQSGQERLPEETQMNLINNMIGREYAMSGYAESSLLERAIADPRVVHYVGDVEPGVRVTPTESKE